MVHVSEKAGAMLHLPGPRKWINNWLRSGAHLSIGEKVDVRVKSVDGPNRRVIVTLLEVGAQRPGGEIAVEKGKASHVSHVRRPGGLTVGTLRPG